MCGGVSAPNGVCLVLGCAPKGVSAQGCLLQRVSAQGGVCPRGVSAKTPPTREQNHRTVKPIEVYEEPQTKKIPHRAVNAGDKDILVQKLRLKCKLETGVAWTHMYYPKI